MAPQRKALVDQAFDLFDTDHSGELSVDDLVAKYDTSRHPKVRSGEWTAKQAVQEFLNVFEGEGGDKNNVVSRQEWHDYHTGLSANIDHDDEFGIMMSNNWGIEYVPKAEVEKIMQIIRDKAAQKGGDKNPKRKAAEMFKFFDTNGTNTIDYKEFCKAMESFSSGLNEKALKTLFKMFDGDGSGEIEYAELVNLVFEGK
jgi:Ca2+-binding EF-hand superfamily protein